MLHADQNHTKLARNSVSTAVHDFGLPTKSQRLRDKEDTLTDETIQRQSCAADLCVDLCTQITCARSISDLAIMSRATDKRLYTEGSTPKKTSSFARTLQRVKFPLRNLSFFVRKTTLSSIKKKRSPQIRASSLLHSSLARPITSEIHQLWLYKNMTTDYKTLAVGVGAG